MVAFHCTAYCIHSYQPVVDRCSAVAQSLHIKHTILQIWSLTTGLLLRTCRGHGNVINDLAVSEDNSMVASASEDMTTRVWSLKVGQISLVWALL